MGSEDLEKRVEELETEIAAIRARTQLPRPGIRRRARWSIANVPLYEISLGADPDRRQLRGHARGIVAIGDVASGVIAIGGYARGVIAIGGLAAGLVSFGGLSVGLLSAVGGVAVGGVAFGGAAVGGIAVGGSAVGYYACGAAATGMHNVSTSERSEDAGAVFRRFGLASSCDTP
jgi:hypothetical protein